LETAVVFSIKRLGANKLDSPGINGSITGDSPKVYERYSPKFDDKEFEKPFALLSNNIRDIDDPT
jgi:hypothetical protein